MRFHDRTLPLGITIGSVDPYHQLNYKLSQKNLSVVFPGRSMDLSTECLIPFSRDVKDRILFHFYLWDISMIWPSSFYT